MKRISPLQVKWTVLEELSTSESLNKEDETTTEFRGKMSRKVQKSSTSILLYEQLTILFFKETKWKIVMHYGFDLGKKDSTEFYE